MKCHIINQQQPQSPLLTLQMAMQKETLRRRKRQILLIVLIVNLNYIFGQTNLVPNNSFEVYTICPVDYNDPPPPPWYINCTKTYRGSYLNSCSIDYCAGVPYNCIKGNNYQPARIGNGYIYLDYYPINRQYLQTQLLDSLKPNKCYYIEFFVSTPNPMKFGCNNNGLLFTKTSFYVDTLQNPYAVYPANPQIVSYGNPIITDTLGWQKISGIYTAQGGEKFITIGNFKTDANTIVQNINPSGYHGAGYIIDDVSVIPLDSITLKADAGVDKNITIGDSTFIGSLTNGLTNVKWYNSLGLEMLDKAGIPGFYVKPLTSTYYVIEQNVCGQYSRDTVNVNVNPMPLKFTDYSLRLTEGSSLRGTKQSVENYWQTANEINVSHFNVERSLNGKDFAIVGKLSAQNKSYNEYSFTDNSSQSTVDGKLYYRIESVDFDGRKQYNETKQINIQHLTSNIVLYPNPAKDYFTISSKEKIKEVKIFDSYGRMILRDCFVPRNDNQISNTIIINIQQLVKGLYIVQIITTKGEIKNEKLVLE